jgi:hypothetical protein
MRIRSQAAVILALSLLASVAQAASPAAGTLSPANPSITFSSGPFAAGNNSDAANPTCIGSGLPVTSAVDCDDFALTVDVPADYRKTHPRDLIFVNVLWTIQNFDAYGLYLLDASGAVIDYQRTERDPVTISVPAAGGTYTIRIIPLQPSPELLTATVSLVPDPTGARATGPAPRFQAVPTPPGMGDGAAGGEMNIGFNPVTKVALSLSYLMTMKTTFPEHLDPPLPECCDSAWQDVSDDLANQNTNDPILFLDPVTRRTFVSQLQAGTPGDSIFVYSDDDGANWTLSPSTMNGGIDHQSVGGGPYSAGGTAAPATGYPHAVYYCSQSVAAAFCTRSDDGGDTFIAPSVLKTSADCDGWTPNIHGHVKVAPDGTAYVPDRNCGGQQAVIVSEDSGASWDVRRLPGTTAGDNDSSLGIARDGTVYYCYVAGDNHPHVAVSRDRGRTWSNDRDIGYKLGVEHAVFANAVAGDPDRAACAFLGTTTPGPYQTTAFTGIWHVYVAMTYDGGDTWHTVNATPDDPVQGRGGIALGGTTALENRNLLDFNEITLDHRGRVLYGFNDGCVGDCIKTGTPNQLDVPTFVNIFTDIFAPGAVPASITKINLEAKPTILRQIGGRSLLAAFDPPQAVAPPLAACLSGGRDASLARLLWKAPDNGGSDIAGYRIYRGLDAGAMSLIGTAGPTVVYDDTTANPLVVDYYYKVTAVNAQGEGVASNVVKLGIGAVPALPNRPPVAQLAASPTAGAPALAVTLDAGGTVDPEGRPLRSYTFDFGDGSDPVTQSGPVIEHTYASEGRYVASVKAVDEEVLRSQNAGTVEILVRTLQLPDPFTFVERSGVATGTFVASETKTLAGFTGTLPIAIDNGGQYRIDGGAWTGTPGTIAAGSTLAVRHVSAGTESTAKVSTVSVGDYATPFRTVTSATDRAPDAFTFGSKTGVEPGAVVESAPVSPVGFNAAAAIVPGSGIAYRIGDGAWTTASGTLLPGQVLQVRHTASATPLAYTKTSLKVGGVAGYFTTRTR